MFEPRPLHVAKSYNFWRCTNDVIMIFWYLFWFQILKNAQRVGSPDNFRGPRSGKFMPEEFVTAVDVAITCANFFQFYFLIAILNSEDKTLDLSFLLPIYG